MKLWRHECCRVFADKLTTLEDKAAFKNELDHQTAILGRSVLEAPEARRRFVVVVGGGGVSSVGIFRVAGGSLVQCSRS